MIPVKLSMRNFMCYRENMTPLNLVGVHTASISGDNGNGKSALVDAMTWALWGKTRAKNDDDLIYARQNDMEVEFDFMAGQQVYRVIRKHARPKSRRASGQSSLDLLISDGANFKQISGNKIRETEKQIISLLHMDYDTFINSAFLRQGHADEFTVSSPAKRKQVLADILGLSLYDHLEDQAKEQAKQQEAERFLAESSINDISQELAQKPAYEAELEQVRSELSDIEQVMKEQQSKLNELRQKKESMENRRTQLAQLEAHVVEISRAMEQWDSQIKQHQSRVTEYGELIARRESIEEGFNKFTEVKKVGDELNQKFRTASALNERTHQL